MSGNVGVLNRSDVQWTPVAEEGPLHPADDRSGWVWNEQPGSSHDPYDEPIDDETEAWVEAGMEAAELAWSEG